MDHNIYPKRLGPPPLRIFDIQFSSKIPFLVLRVYLVNSVKEKEIFYFYLLIPRFNLSFPSLHLHSIRISYNFILRSVSPDSWTEREVITGLWIQFTNKILCPSSSTYLPSNFVQFYSLSRKKNYPLLLFSSLIQPCSTKFNPLNLDITLRFSKFIISHWEKNLSTRHYLPKRHAGVFEPSPGAKRRIARGRGGGEALYHPKAIWERYFKFTSYPSGMFYKEIPVGPDSFPGGRKGRMRAVRLLPSSRAELRLRGKNRDDFRRKNPPENRN